MLRLAILSGLLAIATVTWGAGSGGTCRCRADARAGRRAGLTEQSPGAERQSRGRQKDRSDGGGAAHWAASLQCVLPGILSVYTLRIHLPPGFYRNISQHGTDSGHRQDDPHRAAARHLCRHPGDPAAVAALPLGAARPPTEG